MVVLSSIVLFLLFSMCCFTFISTLMVMRKHGAGWIIGAFFFPITTQILYYFCHKPDLNDIDREKFSNFFGAIVWFVIIISAIFFFTS